MPDIHLRPMETNDWDEVAELIYVSTNYWYQTHGRPAIFSGGPGVALLFCEVYESLDPGCCILATHPATGRIMGSCFYHPREMHVSLGIMNVHPGYVGGGIAVQLLQYIIQKAEKAGKPVRLVSSAMNLDSFSLYTRSGFVPRTVFQDMTIHVPKEGISLSNTENYVRPAMLDDLDRIVALEYELQHIRREKDYRYFIENTSGIWHTSVYENAQGQIDGVLVSVAHPGSNMLGPGVARNEEQASLLIRAELNQHRGRSPVFLIPVTCSNLVQDMYQLGAKNCEIHMSQVRGTYLAGQGVPMPSFMPETA